MAENITLARPYAKAAFEISKETNSIDQWLSWLGQLQDITSFDAFRFVIKNGSVSCDQKMLLLSSVMGDCNEHQRFFLKLLLQNQRLLLLKDIYSLFKSLRDQHFQVKFVSVRAAYSLTEDEQQHLQKFLETVWGSGIDLSFEVDRSLMGGVICRYGDNVFDASLQGVLKSMAQELKG